jgi:hypothetical protein
MVQEFPSGSHFVEIGSWKGRSSSYMAVEICNSGKDIKFDCVDTWDGSDVHKDPNSWCFDPICLKKDGLYIEFLKNVKPVNHIINPIRSSSTSASELYDDESLDFVFIDGDHSYEGVKEDIENWIRKVKVGGIIAGHDYITEDIHSQGVKRAVDEMIPVGEILEHDTCWVYKKTVNKNIIVSVAIGYNWEQIELFIKSLNKTTFRGSVILLSKEYIDIPMQLNFEVINHLVADSNWLNTVNNCRPFYYKEILNIYKDVNRVLLTDCRDVIFQENPFDNFTENLLHFGMEENTIGNCWINTSWIKNTYGEEYFDMVKEKNILNGGIILGEIDKIFELLEYMTTEISNKSYLDTGNNVLIMEQAVPIKYSSDFPERVKENHTHNSKICTLGQSKSFTMRKDNLLINNNGEVYSIVHQYDRFELLEKMIKEIYK